MCRKAVEEERGTLKYVSNWFFTCEMLELKNDEKEFKELRREYKHQISLVG